MMHSIAITHVICAFELSASALFFFATSGTFLLCVDVNHPHDICFELSVPFLLATPGTFQMRVLFTILRETVCRKALDVTSAYRKYSGAS